MQAARGCSAGHEPGNLEYIGKAITVTVLAGFKQRPISEYLWKAFSFGSPFPGNEQFVELRSMPSRLQLEAGTLQGALEQFLGPAAEPAAQSRAELLNPTTHPAPVTVLQEWSR